MAKFHFVEDYQAYIKGLLKEKPRKEAMEYAIGDNFELVGDIEERLLRYAGLRDGQFLVDLGCGSGRLATMLGKRTKIEYLGLDVVQELLDYAAEISPPTYRFQLNHALTLPATDSSVDMFSAFSVFTHLLHTESYLYLEEMMRCLKPGGRVVFSFVEFAYASHWDVFVHTVNAQRHSETPHLNMFVERSAIQAWCSHLGFAVIEFIDGGDGTRWKGSPLGQSIAILEKPPA